MRGRGYILTSSTNRLEKCERHPSGPASAQTPEANASPEIVTSTTRMPRPEHCFCLLYIPPQLDKIHKKDEEGVEAGDAEAGADGTIDEDETKIKEEEEAGRDIAYGLQRLAEKQTALVLMGEPRAAFMLCCTAQTWSHPAETDSFRY